MNQSVHMSDFDMAHNKYLELQHKSIFPFFCRETFMWLVFSVLTLYAPIVSKINFLLTISIDCQEQSLRELIK